jgi:plastocyanin
MLVHRLRLFIALVVLGGLPAYVSAATNHSEISGKVSLVTAAGQSLAPGELTDTLVYFVPKHGKVRVHPGTYTIYTVNMDFRPAAMAIPIGSTVKFTNLDQLLHNLYSATPDSTFDFQFQASGQSVAHTFTHAGPVLISCNVHRSMELDLLVVPTPYVVQVSADGRFSLRGLPPGPGTLYFWNPRAAISQQSVTVPVNDVEQQLLAMKPRVATELNVGNTR